MKPFKRQVVGLCLFSALGWLALHFTDKAQIQTQDFSSTSVTTLCPSNSQIESFFTDYNLQVSKSNFSCAVNDPRAQLYKSLATINRANYKTPVDWGPEFSKMSENIKGYIKKYVKKISLSEKPRTSTVVNSYPSENWIEFTDRILELNPVEMMSMLVHEVRHLEAPQRVHMLCGPGDMPGTEGACDEILATGYKQMSSYNIEAYYLAGLAMFSTQFTEAEKTVAAKTSLALMANRFNNFRDETVYFNDVVYALTQDRKLQLWHPYLKKWLTIEVKLEGDQIERIETANDAFKISIFTKQGKFLTWNLFEGVKTYSESLKQISVTDAKRIVVPNANSDIYMSVLTQGKVKLLSFEIKDGVRQLIDYPFVDKSVQNKYQFTRLFYGDYNEVLLLDSKGEIFRKTQDKYGSAQDLISIEELVKNGPWLEGAPGLVYEDLYLVNKKGQIFRLLVKNKRIPGYLLEDEAQPEHYELQVLSEWQNVEARKFNQGSFGDYVLSQKGEILFQETAQKKIMTLATGMRDFAIMKTLIPSGILQKLLDLPLADVRVKCQLQKASWDPILYRGMGLNKQGQLIFLDTNGECQIADFAGVFSDYKFMNTSPFSEKTHTDLLKNGMNYRSQVKLQLTPRAH